MAGFMALEKWGLKDPPNRLTEGGGSFDDVAGPEKTVVVHPVELRRVGAANEISTMETGTKPDKQSLVLKTLLGW